MTEYSITQTQKKKNLNFNLKIIYTFIVYIYRHLNNVKKKNYKFCKSFQTKQVFDLYNINSVYEYQSNINGYGFLVNNILSTK